MNKYYRLVDRLNRDEIVMDDGKRYYTYRYGAEKWVRSFIMLRYMSPGDSMYDRYTVISEADAVELMEENRKKLDVMLAASVRIASERHKDQTDKSGAPYIEHLQAVANLLESTECKIVAYLHGICEDTDTSPEELSELGIGRRVVNSVNILTGKKEPEYREYLRAVKKDNTAREVKIADLKDNISRLSAAGQTEIEKYKSALKYLEEN